MDEPLGALDRQIRIRLQEELSELLRRLKVTTLLVTHDQTEAFAMADRIAVMHLGTLEQIDTPSTLYRWPRTQFVATFLGSGAIIHAKIVSSCDEASVFADLNGCRFRCRVRGKPAKGSSLHVLIRPEHIALMPSGSAANVTLREGRVQRIVDGRRYPPESAFRRGFTESIHLWPRHFTEGDRRCDYRS